MCIRDRLYSQVGFMKDWFKALVGYTMGNILSVLSFVFAAAVFYTGFWLYGVETEPVLYATLISAVILLIGFVLRFSSVYKKHKRLEKIKNDAEYAVLKLPDYGCFRVAIYLMPEAAKELSWIFILLTGISVVYGAYSAIVQKDLKYITAGAAVFR